MKINHIIGTSFIDYPKEISMVVFTKGCNMRCPYCHNKELEEKELLYTREDVLAFLKKRKGLVDAITISGGEPTLQEGLVEFCRQLKMLKVKIKLDTNGSNPKVLKQLIDEELLDYVAMDIKTSPKKYKPLSGLDFEKVKESINLIQGLKTYEFRTTMYPTISEKDIENIVRRIGHEHYFLQQYRPNGPNDLASYSDNYVAAIGQKFNLKVRGLETNKTICTVASAV
jgi:pyruvate formate lyase activating enzyme